MSEDIFIPTSSADDAIVGPLHTITYITSDKTTVEKAFVQGYGLDSTDWNTPTSKQFKSLNPYFGFAESDTWEHCAFQKNGEGENVQIRVIYVHQKTPAIRPKLDNYYTGGVTISFPINDMVAHEKIMTDLGMPSTMGIKEMEFQGPNGEIYTSAEILYPAPENIYLLGVKRPEIFVPVGPVDSTTGLGGAAYSARNVANSDDVIEFLEKVLNYEIRRDMEFDTTQESDDPTLQANKERFVQAFAPGSQTAYLVIMDYYENTKMGETPNLGTPYRGISMWSFMTEDLDEVYRRAQIENAEVISIPGEIHSPFMPSSRTLLLRDPSGFPIEICESSTK